MPENIFISSMVLGADHSIMVNNVPTGVKLDAFSEKYFEAAKKTPESLEKFGLFGSNIDYNTYYPNAEPADFDPAKDEFIEPVFRLLSACIVSKNYMPTEFSEEVIKASMPLMVGQTVNCDHSTDIGNAIGSVKEVAWQDAYTEGGKRIPGGMNGVLKIDAKANPRIARGINMDPPSIHSNSVTVQFEWKPSHNFKDPYEFWDKLGTYDDKGELVRRIVTKIISYKETSLVSHGADPYAQKIEKGKIINPGYADSVYNSFSEQIKEKMSRNVSHWSFKEVEAVGYNHNTSKNNNEGEQQSSTIQTLKQNSMPEALQQFLDQLFGEGMISLSEGATASTELAITEIKRLITENTSLSAKVADNDSTITSLNEQIDTLKNEAKVNAPFIEMGKTHFNEVKEATLASYKKLSDGKEDANIITLIEGIDSLVTLKAMKKSYEDQLEEKFPLHCADCGSRNVNRASSVSTSENEEKPSDKSIRDTVAGLANAK